MKVRMKSSRVPRSARVALASLMGAAGVVVACGGAAHADPPIPPPILRSSQYPTQCVTSKGVGNLVVRNDCEKRGEYAIGQQIWFRIRVDGTSYFQLHNDTLGCLQQNGPDLAILAVCDENNPGQHWSLSSPLGHTQVRSRDGGILGAFGVAAVVQYRGTSPEQLGHWDSV